MKEFAVTGRVTLNGVRFTILAENEADAARKATAGDYADYDLTGAETIDWEITGRIEHA